MSIKVRNFMKLLKARWEKGFFACVGLDSDTGKIPVFIKEESVEEQIFFFNRNIIEKTYKDTGCYKLNWAFYVAHGPEGLSALIRTIKFIKLVAPDVPIILDAKVGDIENTNNGYIQFSFDAYEQCGADAITVHNYTGMEAMRPFLDCKDKGVIVLCKTSNKGSGEFQDLIVKGEDGIEEPLYCHVARRVNDHWNYNGNCMLVVGATYTKEMARVREIAPNIPLLIPAVGAQQGDLRGAVRAGMNHDRTGFVINSSRGIIFKSDDLDYARRAGDELRKLSDEINKHRLDDDVTPDEVRELFERFEAWKKDGHYIYASEMHGSDYLNKDAIYPWVMAISMLCRAMASRNRDKKIQVVVGPEKGGIILCTWVAYFLTLMTGRTVHAVYAEKDGKGGFVLKRGYDSFVKGKQVLIVEDVANTGGSSEKTKMCVEAAGGIVVDIMAMADRGESGVTALSEFHLPKYAEEDCPKCAQAVPVNTDLGKGAEYLEKKAGRG